MLFCLGQTRLEVKTMFVRKLQPHNSNLATEHDPSSQVYRSHRRGVQNAQAKLRGFAFVPKWNKASGVWIVCVQLSPSEKNRHRKLLFQPNGFCWCSSTVPTLVWQTRKQVPDQETRLGCLQEQILLTGFHTQTPHVLGCICATRFVALNSVTGETNRKHPNLRKINWQYGG